MHLAALDVACRKQRNALCGAVMRGEQLQTLSTLMQMRMRIRSVRRKLKIIATVVARFFYRRIDRTLDCARSVFALAMQIRKRGAVYIERRVQLAALDVACNEQQQ